MSNETNSFRTFSLAVAGSSFVFGTVLFILNLFSRGDFTILIVGLYYVCIAVAINSLFLIVFLILILIDPKDYQEKLLSAAILLINIPIAFIYFLITVNL